MINVTNVINVRREGINKTPRLLLSFRNLSYLVDKGEAFPQVLDPEDFTSSTLFRFANQVEPWLEKWFPTVLITLIFSYCALSTHDAPHYFPKIYTWNRRRAEKERLHAQLICWGWIPRGVEWFASGEHQFGKEGEEWGAGHLRYSWPSSLPEAPLSQEGYLVEQRRHVFSLDVPHYLVDPHTTLGPVTLPPNEFVISCVVQSTFYLLPEKEHPWSTQWVRVSSKHADLLCPDWYEDQSIVSCWEKSFSSKGFSC